MFAKYPDNAPRRMAIAVGGCPLGHLPVGRRVIQQPPGRADDGIEIRANQFDHAGGHGLGPLRLLAQNQDGLTEGRGLLLNAARIAQDG